MKRTMKTMQRLAVAGLLAASTQLSAVAAQAETTVRMWTFLNPEGTSPRELALNQIIENFEAANPEIDVVVEPQVWDQMTPKFLAAHGAGNAPDIIWVVTDLLGEALGSGALADLNPLFLDSWPEEAIKERQDGYWERCAWEGGVHCLFHSRNYYGVIYRKDFLSEAGIDPASLTDWPTFIEAGKKLTIRDDSGNVSRWGFGQQFSEDRADAQMMTSVMLSRQGDLFHEDGRAMWANPIGAEALKLQTEMVTEHEITPPQAVTWSAEDLYEQFAAGRLAMFTGAVVRVSTMQAKVGKENVGFMIWPGVDGKPHSPAVMAGWAVGVWSGSKQIDEAAKFLEYMAGPEADKLWIEVGGQIPASAKNMSEMTDFFAKPENQYIVEAAKGIANYGWISPVKFAVGGYRQALNKAAQNVLSGGMDPMEALEEAEKRFNQQNRR
ncbi:ABC transporter substrate-binding protein [Oricola indica]|jgi:multiple sugar transport system substrate-binding protein|uniref:ABC transporter substrate-binding protein n=1 Tax=Oricola indica TaxID=2872591 RepID=UPI001CBE1346|nr:sugar ABC transporter substrate-binding protein [Oricola indica]